MRIHHVAPHFHPDIGGMETHVHRLSRYLVERGHEVVVHTSRRSYGGRVLPERGALEGIEVRRYIPVVRLGYYTTLFRPRIERADVVHLHGYGHLSNDWTARQVRGSVPTVFSLHHGVAQLPPTRFAAMKRWTYDLLLGRRTLHIVEALVAASEADRRWLASRGISGPRVEVVPTGVGEEAFLPGNPGDARMRFGLGKYFLFLGRLHREKSPTDLVWAIAGLPQGLTAVFAGPDAGAKASLAALAQRLGLGNQIRIVGEVDDRTKRDLLAGCEALVLPSFYEAQGIAILEAWAQGRPVVASRVGGIPLLVTDEKDGLLYAWGDLPALTDRLRRLLSDPALAARIGERGRAQARQRYRWALLAPRFEWLYDRVTAAGARA